MPCAGVRVARFGFIALLLIVSGLCSCVKKAPKPPALKPGAARIIVTATAFADVHVDDVVVGQAPLPAPIDVSPGPHTVIVASNGHRTRSAIVRLEKGEAKKLAIDLDMTAQRIEALSFIGIGGAGVAIGIVFGVLSVVEQRAAAAILDDADGPLAAEDQAEYEDAIHANENDRIGAGVSAGLGLALFVAGALLYAFDAPVLPVKRGALGVTVDF